MRKSKVTIKKENMVRLMLDGLTIRIPEGTSELELHLSTEVSATYSVGMTKEKERGNVDALLDELWNKKDYDAFFDEIKSACSDDKRSKKSKSFKDILNDMFHGDRK